MAISLLQVKMFRLSLFSNQFRNIVCTKYPSTSVQPSCGVKQSVEEKLGLPGKPKRPISVFFRYLKQIRPIVMKENPNLKLIEFGKVAAQKWENLDPKLKNELETEFKRDLDTYNIEKMKYNKKLTPQQKSDIKDARQEAREVKQKKIFKKKVKDLERPTRPPNTFIRFILDKQSERKDTPMKEWQKQMGQEWENLSEDRKAKYADDFKRDIEKYKQDLLNWEEKMIKLGHVDVVRTEVLLSKPDVKK